MAVLRLLFGAVILISWRDLSLIWGSDNPDFFLDVGNEKFCHEFRETLECDFTELERGTRLIVKLCEEEKKKYVRLNISNAHKIQVYQEHVINNTYLINISRLSIEKSQSNVDGTLRLTLDNVIASMVSLSKVHTLKVWNSTVDKLTVESSKEVDIGRKSSINELSITVTDLTPTISDSFVGSIVKLTVTGNAKLKIKNTTVGAVKKMVIDSSKEAVVSDSTTFEFLDTDSIVVKKPGSLLLSDVVLKNVQENAILIKKRLTMTNVTLPPTIPFSAIIIEDEAKIYVENAEFNNKYFSFKMETSNGKFYPFGLLIRSSIEVSKVTHILMIVFIVISAILTLLVILLLILRSRQNEKNTKVTEKNTNVTPETFIEPFYADSVSLTNTNFPLGMPPSENVNRQFDTELVIHPHFQNTDTHNLSPSEDQCQYNDVQTASKTNIKPNISSHHTNFPHGMPPSENVNRQFDTEPVNHPHFQNSDTHNVSTSKDQCLYNDVQTASKTNIKPNISSHHTNFTLGMPPSENVNRQFDTEPVNHPHFQNTDTHNVSPSEDQCLYNDVQTASKTNIKPNIKGKAPALSHHKANKYSPTENSIPDSSSSKPQIPQRTMPPPKPPIAQKLPQIASVHQNFGQPQNAVNQQQPMPPQPEKFGNTIPHQENINPPNKKQSFLQGYLKDQHSKNRMQNSPLPPLPPAPLTMDDDDIYGNEDL